MEKLTKVTFVGLVVIGGPVSGSGGGGVGGRSVLSWSK